MALSSLPTFAALLVLVGAAAPTTVVVDLSPLMPMTAPRLRSLTTESDAIWRPQGVAFTWITTAAPVPPGTNIRVVSEREAASTVCAGDERRLESGRRLGAVTFRQGTSAGRTLTLSVDVASRMVDGLVWEGRRVADAPRSLREHLVGRALGRVLAHEIGHIVLDVPSHSADGLMRSEFGADELVAASRHPFALSDGLVPLLRARLTELAARPPVAEGDPGRGPGPRRPDAGCL